jgi:FkbM family methyltransferase
MPTLRQSILAAILRRYPFYSGIGSLANSQLLSLLAGESVEHVWCSTRGGDVLAPLHDYVGRAAYYFGDLDPKITNVCRLLVKPGSTVCDIGANIGIVTLILSKLVGESGQVFAFEPNPRCFDALEAAVRHNQITNVSVEQFALGSESGELELVFPEHNAGAGSLKRRSIDKVGHSIRVLVRKLDDFAAEHGINRIQFMKIDVEGFEGEVLRGGRQILASHRPDAILFEANDKGTGKLSNLPVFACLMDLDYAFLSLPKKLLKIRPRLLDPCIVSECPSHDIIAIPRGATFNAAIDKLQATI